jgi:hypothetical protein
MVEHHPMSGATYRAQLADVAKRAQALEARARKEWSALPIDDPRHASWQRIERRYATIRGNAEHLLFIYKRPRPRAATPLKRLRYYVHLLFF